MKKTVKNIFIGSLILGIGALTVKLVKGKKNNESFEKEEELRKYHKLADINEQRILELEKENEEKDLEIKEYEIKHQNDEEQLKEYEIKHQKDDCVKEYSIGSRKAV